MAIGGFYTPNSVQQALRVMRSFYRFRWVVSVEIVLVDRTRY
jgi:hypothetical protein